MIKYLGSKRALLPVIVEAISRCVPPRAADSDETSRTPTVLDLFSGTSRVGHALKRAGYRVVANDHNAYAATLARCYVQADAADVLGDAMKLVQEFNALPGSPGYFTQTFCERSRFVQPRNGARVDAIREAIAAKGLEPELEAVMLVSLMEAADRVDSTTGLQMAYLKKWSPRSHNDLELRVPEVLPRAAGAEGQKGKCTALCMDALDAARAIDADVAYIDPPYNQHSYLGNYHMWESLVRWDKPAVYGVACKRVDVRERQSPFNSRREFAGALRSVLESVRAPLLVVSFSDEGYITRHDLELMLREIAGPEGSVEIIANDFRRYVGAQIGIYNPRGEKTGTVSHLTNTEFIFIVRKTPASTGLTGVSEPPTLHQVGVARDGSLSSLC